MSLSLAGFVTPETESSHWYFWGMARNFQAQDAELIERTKVQQGEIFTQDLSVLEAQQRNLDDHSERRLLMLKIDSGGVQSRRVIGRLVKAEQEKNATASA
ncbi:MAG: hypothetical protein H5U29_02845 [Pusillimonas sp.]|nr:hypothetical protein [Pusillimonas sp.]